MIPKILVNWFDNLRLQLSRQDALLILSLLGLLSGFAAGLVIVLFRLLVESVQSLLLPGGIPENYEALSWMIRGLLPLLGGLVLGLMFHRFAEELRVLGVPRVLERLIYHQGHLSFRGLLLQFIGAASGSLLGQYLNLPNNIIRTLVGCGTTAGISASFDTPLAGVIFALEVVMMEYTLISFIPIMLAAVSANSLSLIVFDGERVFDIGGFQLGSLHELLFILLLGLAAGAASAAYVHLIQIIGNRTRLMSTQLRYALAGVLAGLFGIAPPR
ncbi:MAG: chloride channel protein [Candidatus Thiodiazotropha sp.]